jgi:hypothetical protein
MRGIAEVMTAMEKDIRISHSRAEFLTTAPPDRREARDTT